MTAEAINAATLALKKALIERALGGEMNHHLGYPPGAAKPSNTTNQRNGKGAKTVLTEDGPLRIDVPRDRDGSFEPPVKRSGICWIRYGIEGSMSRKGDCWDNAVAENFFATLKSERIRWRHYATREEARRDIVSYIGMHYNSRRLHSYLYYQSPNEFEKAQLLKNAA